MSNLVVVGFPKAQEAEEVRRELVTIQQEHLIALEDAVVLEHGEDGHVHLRQAINMTAAGAMGGSFWGLLIGLLFANPLLGLAVGAGAVVWRESHPRLVDVMSPLVLGRIACSFIIVIIMCWLQLWSQVWRLLGLRLQLRLWL